MSTKKIFYNHLISSDFLGNCLLTIVIFHYWLDRPIMLYVYTHINQSQIKYATFIAFLGNTYFLLSILLLLLSYFLLLRRQICHVYKIYYLLLTIIISGLTCDLLKILFGRARPLEWVLHHLYGFYGYSLKAKMWSFPSGHATVITALMIGLAIFFPKYRYGFFLVALVSSACRVLGEVHYVSDIIAGMYLGAVGAILIARLIYYYSPNLFIGRLNDANH